MGFVSLRELLSFALLGSLAVGAAFATGRPARRESVGRPGWSNTCSAPGRSSNEAALSLR